MGASLRKIGREECGPITGTLDDFSGNFSAANASQQITAANNNRSYLHIQNHGPEAMWVQFGGVAVASQPSIVIWPGESYVPSFVDQRAIHAISSDATNTFTAKQG
jgi:hypothetical protein